MVSKNLLAYIIISIMISACLIYFGCKQPNDAPYTAEDGSVWTLVNEAGFGSENNISVVAMAQYAGALYAVTRNDAEGCEVWRMKDGTWEQVLFPGGETNGFYGNQYINNVWARMIVFQDKLYVGVSSGLQGGFLYSTGCEVWRYDGSAWEAVISDKKDTEEFGTITAMSGCGKDDGDITARVTDASKAWTVDQWAGGVLQITSGDGIYRKLDIVGNSADTLTVQQNEQAGNVGSEYTVCDSSATYNNPYPSYSYTVGPIAAGDTYTIGTGTDENGFGNFWNKTITAMTVFNGTLYVSTGLNYEYGAQVWYTSDGDTWQVTQAENSFGNYHDDAGYPNGQKPVSTSIPDLCVSDVSGESVLYAGGTGSSGSLGSCARMARLTDAGWELIVDVNVDDNDEGSNENGFGDGMACTMNTGNFMPWSLAHFNGLLHAGVNSLGGARVLYSADGSAADGSWTYSVGGDADLPEGFDGVVNEAMPDTYQNLAPNLFVFGDALYAGLVTLFLPEYGATEKYLTGSQIWKTTDGIDWSVVTDDGFGDSQIVIFEAFAVYSGELYVAGSKGASSTPTGLGGCKVYKMSTPGS